MAHLDMTREEMLTRANDYRQLALNCEGGYPGLIDELNDLADEYVMLAAEADAQPSMRRASG
jgi:hypothetical protein